MTIDSATFRAVLGRFATGVTIVTARDEDGKDQGMTVSAFCSLSLHPPLVLLCLDHAATLLPALPLETVFAVNVLSEGQEALSRRFASEVDNRFDGVGYTRGPSGSPLLDEALAHVECRVEARHEAGDHTILVGRVEYVQASEVAGPLLYYRSGYARLVR
jgi:flavin reductase (DIM6/NTAB) family NADH-FMN oxidoreductase RutF